MDRTLGKKLMNAKNCTLAGRFGVILHLKEKACDRGFNKVEILCL
jgi:hypothetical protein